MGQYNVKKGESIDKVLKKFKRQLRRDGVIDDMKKKEYYEKPSERRKREESAAKRRTYLASIDE
ncbi:MAG: 30S ribosomal protein S21 [Candidatus Margulisiibacteriota bacterium]